ncbi:MAG: hypothetical protein ABGY15_12575, partial [bacterium]
RWTVARWTVTRWMGLTLSPDGEVSSREIPPRSVSFSWVRWTAWNPSVQDGEWFHRIQFHPVLG